MADKSDNNNMIYDSYDLDLANTTIQSFYTEIENTTQLYRDWKCDKHVQYR